MAHGAVVIEYEPSGRLTNRAGLRAAQRQAEEYAELLALEEGRHVDEYILVTWDAGTVCFGRIREKRAKWEAATSFGEAAAQRLLQHMQDDGAPLVHPRLLSELVGPDSEFGAELIPLFYSSIIRAAKRRQTSKTKLLFVEWRRLFGQVAGVQSERLKQLLVSQSRAHGRTYGDEPAAYLFALNTFIAIVAKLVAALSLRRVSEDLTDSSVPIRSRIDALESGRVFSEAGVTNMLSGDFFSWYRDDSNWSAFSPWIERLIGRLGGINFDVARKSAESTRDLFKGMYQSFVPSALRHALGEYYTPDWLASHLLDVLKWETGKGLLDPTCGSGTFLVEALRRRLVRRDKRATAAGLLDGIYGLDLNPLAVLASRASLIVFLSGHIDPRRPLTLPVFLADAINPAQPSGAVYRHDLQTELGVKTFFAPRAIVDDGRAFAVFAQVRTLVEAGINSTKILSTVAREFQLTNLDTESISSLQKTIDTLVDLQRRGWDGIWCSILAERFVAGSLPPAPYVCGNPPWVKWSHLPPEYAEFIKPRCLELGVFSEDRWVGGIESDISTVVTYEALERWLAPNGTLAFLITGTVFSNESSQGFRRFVIPRSGVRCRVLRVEDFGAVAPFDGVQNHATMLVVRRDRKNKYPVTYRVWEPPRVNGRVIRTFASAEHFRRRARNRDLLAIPVPGTDEGPWLKGTEGQLRLWSRLFGASAGDRYRARKGVTTDCNGVYFVKVLGRADSLATISNDPTLGRKLLARVTRQVEAEHVFPLLRGRGVSAFRAIPDVDYRVLVPQRGMHGDPDLPVQSPKAYQYLAAFKSTLEKRSSLNRFQRNQPFWSLWSTGAYTFSPYKVVWQEMSGGRFEAAYIGSATDRILGRRLVIPDHKLYFVPCDQQVEAAYLTAILNAPNVAQAISSYAAQLSLGVSVVEYLRIPPWDQRNTSHRELASLAMKITRRGDGPTAKELGLLAQIVGRVFRDGHMK